jgi:hypothetical protein
MGGVKVRTAPPFLISALYGGEQSASHTSHFTPGKEPLVSIVEEDGWAPELVWMLWNREKSLVPARN